MTEFLSIVITWFAKGAAVGGGAALGVVLMTRFFPPSLKVNVGTFPIIIKRDNA
jgi:hypothetical protein